MHLRLRSLLLHFIVLVGLVAGMAAQSRVQIRVVDENGVAVPNAVAVGQQGQAAAVTLRTDYLGRCSFPAWSNEPYSLRVEKPGFYVLKQAQVNVGDDSQVVLTHQQQVQQEINVVGSAPTIDPEQTSDAARMETAE